MILVVDASVALKWLRTNTKKFLVFAICCSPIVACSPVVSTEDLRYTENKNNYELNVNEKYQVIYQTILRMGRKCHEKLRWSLYPVPDRVVVDGKMNKLRKTGYVSIVLYPGIIGDAATIALVVIDISAVDREETRVAVYSQSSWNQFANAVQNWILNDSQECGPEG